MVPLTLLHLRKQLAGKRIIWFLDNSVSLHSIIKGSARDAALDRSIAIVKLLQGHAHIEIWYEFVDSEGNWSDGISRRLAADPFARAHGFPISELIPDAEWWLGDIQATMERIRAL